MKPRPARARPDAADSRGAAWLCLRWAVLATLLALAWQFLTVTFNYRGNWTALFRTSQKLEPPPELAAGTYRIPGGYDGQFYRYMAHDPWLRKGYHRYLDDVRPRYRRILLPAVAWLLAGGNARFIDAAFIAAVLLCVLLGSYYLSRYAHHHGRHPAWGLAFLLVPATPISLDRLTVDVALAACCTAFAWYATRGSPGPLALTLALAVLARETGALLIAAACLEALWRRRLPRAVLYAAAVLPALFWFHFVATRLVASGMPAHPFFPHWLLNRPLVGMVMKLFRPESYPLDPVKLLVARAADVLALIGVLLALGLALWRLLRRHFDAEAFGALAFVGLALVISDPNYWGDVNGYGRTISPLLLLVALPAAAGGSLWLLLPALLVDLRLGIQFASPALGILRNLF